MTPVDVERIDGVRIAHTHGDVDAANASLVEEVLAESLEPDGDCLVIDLGETRYLDSAALDMLFRLHRRLRQRRGSLHVVLPVDSPLRRLATIVGMPDVVPVHESVAEALTACARERHTKADEDFPRLTEDAERDRNAHDSNCRR